MPLSPWQKARKVSEARERKIRKEKTRLLNSGRIDEARELHAAMLMNARNWQRAFSVKPERKIKLISDSQMT